MLAPEKSPAFQFYPKEFITDGHVAEMSLQERGAYITLLCICWQERSLSADPSRLAHIVGLPARTFARIWPHIQPCFVEADGRLTHRRLEKERTKQEVFRQHQSRKGKASAASRGSTAVQPDCNRGSTEPQPDTQPKVNSPISDLRSPISLPLEERKSGGGKRPLIRNEKFAVHRWMQDQLIADLGSHADGFDLDEWLMMTVPAMAAQEPDLVEDWWKWLRGKTFQEAKRRGIPQAGTSTKLSPEDEAAATLALLKRREAGDWTRQ